MIRKAVIGYTKAPGSMETPEHVANHGSKGSHIEMETHVVYNENPNTKEIAETPSSTIDESETFRKCSGCELNTKAISELWKRLTTLENQTTCSCLMVNTASKCDSCEDLKMRVKQLETERNNLLTIIKLLSQDKQTSSTDA